MTARKAKRSALVHHEREHIVGRVVQKSGGTASRQLGVEENLNALCLAFCALIGYACTFFIILAVWLVFAVWIGGLLTLSERVPNPY